MLIVYGDRISQDLLLRFVKVNTVQTDGIVSGFSPLKIFTGGGALEKRMKFKLSHA